MNAYANKNGAKLLAAVAILAMVVCAFAVITPSENTDAAVTIEDASYNDLSTALGQADVGPETVIELKSNQTLTESVDLKEAKIVLNGFAIYTDANTKMIQNGTIVGDDDYDHIIVNGAPTLTIQNITFTDIGYYAIDVNSSADVTIRGCVFEGSATSAINLNCVNNTPTVDVTDCEFNGTYIEGAISFDMGSTVTNSSELTINGNTDGTPLSVSIGSARGNIVLGGDSTNVIRGENVSISDVYLAMSSNYDAKLTIASGSVSVNNIYADGTGTVEVQDGATLNAVSSEAPVTVVEGGTANIEESVITPSGDLAQQINDAFKTSDTVTLEGIAASDNVSFTRTITIPANHTLEIINSYISGGTFDVDGTLYLDNSYVYAGADVDESTGEITAINTHNPTTTTSLTQDTNVGIGDSLTLTGEVPSGVTLSVYGTLITNDLTANGAITAYVGSTVTINGTVTVADEFNLETGAKLELNGTITVRNDRDGGASLNVKTGAEMTVTSEGTVNVNRATANGAAANVLDIDGTFVLEGTMNVTGTLYGQVENKGTITFSGTAGDNANNKTTIVMYDGVSMTVTSVTGYMYITDGSDDKIILDYLGKDTRLGEEKYSTGNTVILNNVRGITVSEEITSATDKVGNVTYRSYMANMTVSGNATVVSGQTSGSVSVNGACTDALDGLGADDQRLGTLTVGDVTVGAGVTFGFAGTTIVSGQFTAIAQSTSTLAAAAVLNEGTVTVTGTMTLTEGNASNLEDRVVNAVRYYVLDETDGTMTVYYTNFAAALGATVYNNEITVLGSVTAEGSTELPAGMTLMVQGTLTIGTDAEFTVAATAQLVNNGSVVVNGVMIITDNNTGLSGNTPEYDVKKTVGSTDTYSSLTYALANASSGDVIILSDSVILRADTVIPEGVTLETGRNEVTLDDITLTVNGTFAVQNGGNVVKDGSDAEIIVNGVMSDASSVLTLSGLDIAGAYFTLRNVEYVSNVAYAAANIGNGTTITIKGTVTCSDVTFTAGTSGLTVTVENGAVLSAGTITLDGSTMTVAVGGTMTGSIAAASGDSTAAVDLDRMEAIGQDFVIDSTVDETVDGEVDVMTINGYINEGTVTISSGNVEIDTTVVVNSTNRTSAQNGLLNIASGATLSVPESAELYVRANEDATKTSMSVEGTLDIDNAAYVTGLAVIDGTVNVNDDADLIVTANEGVSGTLTVNGTVAVSETEDARGDFIIGNIDGSGVVSVNGTITGQVSIDNNNAYLKVYPSADIEGADIEWDYITSQSSAESTVFYVNGAEYMTVYGNGNSGVTIDTILNAETFDMPGYDVGYKTGSNTEKGLYLYSNWYSTEAMTPGTEVEDTDNLRSFDAVYAEAEVANVIGTISEGTGLTLYIDGLTISNWMTYEDNKYSYYLPVGTHTVSIAANAGYNADDATITFNGQTIANGGTITIEAGATTFTLAASGAVPASSVSGGSSSSDDRMGLTDYLLIILVVLIVIMAIMVAMRLMRS